MSYFAELKLDDDDGNSANEGQLDVVPHDESSHNIQWTYSDAEVVQQDCEGDLREQDNEGFKDLTDMITIPFNYPVLQKQGDNLAYGSRSKTFSLSLLSALTEEGTLSNLVVEGSVDQSVFEHFVYHTLKTLS